MENAENQQRKYSQSQGLPEVKKPSLVYTWPFLINLLKAADFIVLIISGFAAYQIRFETFFPDKNHQLFLFFSSIVMMVSLYVAKAYRIKTVSNLNNQLTSLFSAGISALLISLACGFLSKSLEDFSRTWVVLTVITGGSLLCFNRIIFTLSVLNSIRTGHFIENIVIVGATTRAQKLIESLLTVENSGIRLLGVFEDRTHLEKRPLPGMAGFPILGTTDEMIEFVRRNDVDRIVVTLPWISSERIDILLLKMRTVPVRIDLVPDEMIWRFREIGMERLGKIPILTIVNAKVDQQSGALKRAFDFFLSLIILTAISPIMLIIGIAIKIDSKGPVFFKQKRHGFNNQIFDVYKFRSMTSSPLEQKVIEQATRNDARVTRVGKFIRRTSLDELPQFFNVMQGTMSIVGPRPHAVQHNMEYAKVITEFYARHNVKPGITGWAQVNGLRGETDTEEKMRRRVALDLNYIESWSLLMDIKIIIMTAVTVWFQDTAY